MVPKTLLRPLSVFSATARFPTMSSGGVEFQLSASSVLKILKGDLTRWSVDGSSDAIVNPANERMLGGGGADGAIHRAAGPELRAACYDAPEVRRGVRCPTGEARITRGFQLPASHVIHTVGPIYETDENPQVSLKNAYRNSVRVAKENNIQFVAFPAISCGVYGYPYEEAATMAISTVKELENDFKEAFFYVVYFGSQRDIIDLKSERPRRLFFEVHFVLFSDEIYDVWLNKANELLQN